MKLAGHMQGSSEASLAGRGHCETTPKSTAASRTRPESAVLPDPWVFYEGCSLPQSLASGVSQQQH